MDSIDNFRAKNFDINSIASSSISAEKENISNGNESRKPETQMKIHTFYTCNRWENDGEQRQHHQRKTTEEGRDGNKDANLYGNKLFFSITFINLILIIDYNHNINNFTTTIIINIETNR
ncbi:hypothetical protein QR98_0012400 [Sarcoptes scabiei]|uniref:Uncharacterized protein n=1 Tax=Sarcoptes scabiei TaxID=52283 RepID=A0A131ZVZ5_SARSC|nr:hypothetical protein QR98_0012400 [Sarcoptes scabiei]